MKQRDRKKAFERHWLDRAMSARPDLLSGDIIEGEAPDFILVAGGRRTGVELTRFIADPGERPHPEQQTSLQRQTLADAYLKYNARSNVPLRVQAIFTRVPFASAIQVKACADALSSYLVQRTADLHAWERVEWRAGDIALPPQLAAVHATVMPETKFAHWTSASAGWVRSASRLELERIVASKAHRAVTYRQTVDEIVLLIVFDGYPKLGRSIYPPDEPVSFALDTPFDQILCLEAFKGRVTAIPAFRPTT